MTTKTISWLDFKLGLRMLIKYPWLTVAGGIGMAVAIAIGGAVVAAVAILISRQLARAERNMPEPAVT